MAVAKKVKEKIDIVPLTMGNVLIHVVGQDLIMNRFSKKAREQLLFPKGRMNTAEKAENLKHDPIAEYRESVYLNRDSNESTAVHLPPNMIVKAIASAALRVPGATKAEIEQLVTVKSRQINLYGIPRLRMDMTRSSDMARTPDVRTRAHFSEFACCYELEFVSSLIKSSQVINLAAAAGLIVGYGDWRPQKGGLSGKFKVVGPDDDDYQRIVKTGGRAAQLEALENPVALDADAEEMLAWFHAEALRREKAVPSRTTKDGIVVDLPPPHVVDKKQKKAGNGKRPRA
jgi:hypothetical protein